VSPRKPTGRPPGRPRGPARVLILVRLEPRQARAVRTEATRRQRKAGAPQPDVSAVMREAVAAWLAKRGDRP